MKTIYIPRFAETHGLLPGDPQTPEEIFIAKRRIRIAMIRFTSLKSFRKDSDGMLGIEGQAPTPAWFGWRWIAALDDPDRS